MKLIYHSAMYLYQGILHLVAPFKPKAKQMVEGHAQVENYLRVHRQPGARYFWFHAASLGEFEQGRPVIEAIKRTMPEVKIALSFFSPSGYEIRKNYEGADLIFYLPIDTPSNARRVLDLLQPERAFFIKYEFWANYLCELKQRQIPVTLFSAIFRSEQIFFKPYGGFFRSLLSIYDHLYVQDHESARLLAGIGIDTAQVVGDTRFDRVLEIQRQAKSLPLIKSMFEGSSFTLVAGSSWQPDEELLIQYYNEHPEMGLIIAPHEIHRSHIQSICALLKHPYVLYSELEKDSQLTRQANCLIVDTIGILSSVYQFADVAYIGGGFGVGIHNTLEAAVYGIPVVFGPNYTRFKEACDLIAHQAACSITTYESLASQLDHWQSHADDLSKGGEAATAYVQQMSGATSKIVAQLPV